MSSAAVVELAVAPNEAVAAIWRELLQAEGIPVSVRLAGAGLAYFSPALCEHILLVRAMDADRAHQLLDDYASAADEIQLDA
jgi:hypothetical protein